MAASHCFDFLPISELVCFHSDMSRQVRLNDDMITLESAFYSILSVAFLCCLEATISWPYLDILNKLMMTITRFVLDRFGYRIMIMGCELVVVPLLLAHIWRADTHVSEAWLMWEWWRWWWWLYLKSVHYNILLLRWLTTILSSVENRESEMSVKQGRRRSRRKSLFTYFIYLTSCD